MGNYGIRRSTVTNDCGAVKCDLLSLLNHHIATETTKYDTDCEPPPPCRLSAVKKCMNNVHTSGTDWDALMQLERTSAMQPIHVTIQHVTECISSTLKHRLHRGHVVALFTFLADVCLSKLCRNEPVDVQATVSIMVNLLVEKHLMACIEFIKLLDTTEI